MARVNGQALAFDVARRYNIDPDLFASQIYQESKFQPNALSPVGARGPAQIMPSTWNAPGFGLQFSGSIDNYEDNMNAGGQYMSALLNRYDGDYEKALAAYNWGAGNADKWNKDYSALPEETRNYLLNIQRRAGRDFSNDGMQTIADEDGQSRNSPVTLADDPEDEKKGLTFHPGMLLSSLGAALGATAMGEVATDELAAIRQSYFDEQAYQAEQEQKERARAALIQVVGANSEYGQALAQGADPAVIMQQYSQDRGFAHDAAMQERGFGQERDMFGMRAGHDLNMQERGFANSAEADERAHGYRLGEQAAQNEWQLGQYKMTRADEQADAAKQGKEAQKVLADRYRKLGMADRADEVLSADPAAFANPSMTGQLLGALDQPGLTPLQRKQAEAAAYTAMPDGPEKKAFGQIIGVEEPGSDTFQEEYDKKSAAKYSDRADEYESRAQSASTQLYQLDEFEQALERSPTTGFAAETRMAAMRAAQFFGIGDADKLSDTELMDAIGKQVTLALRNAGGENQMPGAMSDADRDFLKAIAPGIENTPEGNRKKIALLRKIAQREQETATAARQYIAEHGRLDNGFDMERDAWNKANPLFAGEDGYRPTGDYGASPVYTGANGVKIYAE